MPGPLPGLAGAGTVRVREGAAALHAPPPARVGAYLLYCIVQCILYTVYYSIPSRPAGPRRGSGKLALS